MSSKPLNKALLVSVLTFAFAVAFHAISFALAITDIGTHQPDGTILAGFSAETGKPIFAMPADADVTMNFNDTPAYVAKLNQQKALGHDDWRVPTKTELNVLFQNNDKGALKGTFNVTGSDSAGWYWSSTPSGDTAAYQQRFKDGLQDFNGRLRTSSVRCVR